MKENIAPAPAARDIVDAMSVVSFDFKKSHDHVKYGFVAQDLVNTAPWAVNVGSREDCPEFCGMNGIWGVDHSKLVPVLVKAHQEVSQELKETKEKLQTAEGEIVSLKVKMDAILHRLWKLENPDA